MASQLKKTRTITDKISVNGTLSEDGTKILYMDEDKVEQVISISECLNNFKGRFISFAVSEKSELDLPDDNSEDEDEDK